MDRDAIERARIRLAAAGEGGRDDAALERDGKTIFWYNLIYEFLVTHEQRDDLDGHGGHGFEWIRGEVRRDRRAQHRSLGFGLREPAAMDCGAGGVHDRADHRERRVPACEGRCAGARRRSR